MLKDNLTAYFLCLFFSVRRGVLSAVYCFRVPFFKLYAVAGSSGPYRPFWGGGGRTLPINSWDSLLMGIEGMKNGFARFYITAMSFVGT